MTDVQIMTLVVPLVIALAALTHRNSRIGEAKETLRAEMALGFERVNTRIDKVEERLNARFDKMDARFDRLEEALKVHELEHHR